MKRKIALCLACMLLSALLLSMGAASAADPKKTIHLNYYENYSPYPPVYDYTLSTSVDIGPGQSFSYTQLSSAGFSIDGIKSGPSTILYADANSTMNILVTRYPRPVATPYSEVYGSSPTTSPGPFGYGYYYNGTPKPVPSGLVIGPSTFEAARGKSYKFLKCRLDGELIAPEELLWSSSDTVIATVRNGVVRARRAGSVVIMAKTADGSKSASVVFSIS